MSLNDEQLEGTRRELARNRELSELTVETIAVELQWEMSRLERTLAIDAGSDPADIWMLRDLLERTVRENGGTPERYSVLTEDMRSSAQRWFGLPKRR